MARRTRMKPTPQVYLIASPIGNYQDIGLRTLEILRQVDWIACEDTRITKELLKHHKILDKKLISHHEHNETNSSKGILELLEQGDSLALVSDAGTPQISDPGFKLIELCYQNEIEVHSVPGPSSVITALSLCPFGGKDFLFAGFLGAKSRKKEMQKYQSIHCKLVFFESPHRLLEHLNDAKQVFNGREVFIARELTKKYEQKRRSSIEEMIDYFQQNKPKGEFVVIYSSPTRPKLSFAEIEERIDKLLKLNRSTSEIVKDLLNDVNLKKKEIYQLILDREEKWKK